MSEREDTSLRANRRTSDITDRMDNSFYSGAVTTGHLNLGLLVGNAMQIVGLHWLFTDRNSNPLTVTSGDD